MCCGAIAMAHSAPRPCNARPRTHAAVFFFGGALDFFRRRDHPRLTFAGPTPHALVRSSVAQGDVLYNGLEKALTPLTGDSVGAVELSEALSEVCACTLALSDIQFGEKRCVQKSIV